MILRRVTTGAREDSILHVDEVGPFYYPDILTVDGLVMIRRVAGDVVLGNELRAMTNMVVQSVPGIVMPQVLEVKGNLALSDLPIVDLPEILVVGGTLMLGNLPYLDTIHNGVTVYERSS